VADDDIDLTFEEGEKTVTYHYEKNPEPAAPKTGDNITVAAVIGVMATAGAGIVFTRKRR
jgi:LPXTG-motif cell wall-anchored protein